MCYGTPCFPSYSVFPTPQFIVVERCRKCRTCEGPWEADDADLKHKVEALEKQLQNVLGRESAASDSLLRIEAKLAEERSEREALKKELLGIGAGEVAKFTKQVNYARCVQGKLACRVDRFERATNCSKKQMRRHLSEEKTRLENLEASLLAKLAKCDAVHGENGKLANLVDQRVKEAAKQFTVMKDAKLAEVRSDEGQLHEMEDMKSSAQLPSVPRLTSITTAPIPSNSSVKSIASASEEDEERMRHPTLVVDRVLKKNHAKFEEEADKLFRQAMAHAMGALAVPP